MTKKQIAITIVGGALIGGLTTAAGIFAGNLAITAIFATSAALITALVSYLGGKSES